MIESVRSVLDSEPLRTHFRFPEGICPFCQGTDCIRYGRSKLGAQRRKCKRCGRVHNVGSTGTVISRSKIDYEVRMRFAEWFVDRLSCQRAAERPGVCKKTAWFMRIRTPEALYRNLPAFRVKEGCGAERDEPYFGESFKGTGFEGMEHMPREPRPPMIARSSRGSATTRYASSRRLTMQATSSSTCPAEEP